MLDIIQSLKVSAKVVSGNELHKWGDVSGSSHECDNRSDMLIDVYVSVSHSIVHKSHSLYIYIPSG